ncbi:MAG: S-ribosylhomocysteine lyase [Limnochordia bacterium]|jgi:S-ribosylhomocysteine lyase
MTTIKVESFSLDHTKVHAPYVRQAGVIDTPKGDVITKYDLRFTQPNKNIMPTGAVHALEHFLAGFLREELSDVIDLSPMGCRTGFYLIRLGEASETEIAQALIRSLDKILAADSVPARSAVQCGNYRDLSLFGAQEYAKEVQGGLKEKYA